MTECLTKESFFNQCADKNSIGKLYIDGWIKFPKRKKILFTYGVQCIITKYNPSAYLRAAAVPYHLDCWLGVTVQYRPAGNFARDSKYS